MLGKLSIDPQAIMYIIKLVHNTTRHIGIIKTRFVNIYNALYPGGSTLSSRLKAKSETECNLSYTRE